MIQTIITILILGFFAVLNAPTVQANEDLDSMAPNALHTYFFDSVDEDTSVTLDLRSALELHKKSALDKYPAYYVNYALKGNIVPTHASTTYVESDVVTSLQLGTSKRGTEYKLDFITKGETVYIRFPETRIKSVKNKWIEVPAVRATDFAEALELEELFDIALTKNDDPNPIAAFDASAALARKLGLFQFFDGDVGDSIVVENATRYDLIYRSDVFAAYFKELKKTIAEMPGDNEVTVFSIEGFESGIKNNEFVDKITDRSYVSLWFDNVTKLPVRMVDVMVIPPFEKRKETVFTYTDISLKDYGVKMTVVAPKSTISFADAVDALDLNLQVDLDTQDPAARLKELLSAYKKAKKADKAYLSYSIGDAYGALDDAAQAAAYYKKAAAASKKKSVDQYLSLANAEWELGNVAKVKEYFELALKVDPKNDAVLNQYGWFLLGLNVVTAQTRDLEKALEVNQKLVKGLVDDSNLQNLYATYMLLGRTADAEKLKKKFDNFDAKENYMVLARIYHRLGDKKQSDLYVQKAVEAGYVQSIRDKRFLALQF